MRNTDSRTATSYCYSAASKKYAALFFDRVWAHRNNIGWGHDLTPPVVAFFDENVNEEYFDELDASPEWHSALHARDVFTVGNLMATRAAAIGRAHGYPIVPLFATKQSINKYVGSGTSVVYQAALENVQVVDDEHLSWLQVLEIRSDPEAIRKLRDFRIWATTVSDSFSINQVHDLLEQKLDDYDWSLQKHGLQTKLGAMSLLVDWRGALTTASGAVMGLALGGSAGAALAAGVTLGARAVAYITERAIARNDLLHGPAREIAALHELREQLSRVQPTS